MIDFGSVSTLTGKFRLIRRRVAAFVGKNRFTCCASFENSVTPNPPLSHFQYQAVLQNSSTVQAAALQRCSALIMVIWKLLTKD